MVWSTVFASESKESANANRSNLGGYDPVPERKKTNLMKRENT